MTVWSFICLFIYLIIFYIYFIFCMDFPALTKLLSNRSLNRGELPEPLYYSLPELGFLLKGVGLVLGGEGVIYDHTAV